MSLLSYGQREDNTAEESVRRRRSLVILTPLVDVVFILLVFFMLASSFSDRRIIRMLTPAAAQRTTQSDPTGALLVRMRSDGTLNLSGVRMTPSQLAQEVAGRSVSGVPYSYLVQPDQGVSLQQVVSVVDLLRASGAHAVSLTRRP